MFRNQHGKGCRCAACQCQYSSEVISLRAMFERTGQAWPVEGTKGAAVLADLSAHGNDSWMSPTGQQMMAQLRKERPAELAAFFHETLA